MKTGNQIFAEYLTTRYSSKYWRINKLGQDGAFDEAPIQQQEQDNNKEIIPDNSLTYTPANPQDRTKPDKTESAVKEILAICNNIGILKQSMEVYLNKYKVSKQDKDLIGQTQISTIKRLQSYIGVLKNQASYNGNLFKFPAIISACEKIGDIEYMMKNLYAAAISVGREDIELNANVIDFESSITKILKDCQVINSKTSNILSPY